MDEENKMNWLTELAVCKLQEPDDGRRADCIDENKNNLQITHIIQNLRIREKQSGCPSYCRTTTLLYSYNCNDS